MLRDHNAVAMFAGFAVYHNLCVDSTTCIARPFYSRCLVLAHYHNLFGDLMVGITYPCVAEFLLKSL